MFWIVCDPSSGSIELYLTEIIHSGSQMFVVCLVGVWQRILNQWCVYSTTGRELVPSLSYCCVLGRCLEANFVPVVCVYGTMGRELVPSPSYCRVLSRCLAVNFEPVVCVYGTMGRELVPSPSYHTHTPLVQNYAAKH